jgi:hypothetical protein
VNGALRLTPKETTPLSCDSATEGSMYYNKPMQQILICDGLGWNEFKGEQGIQGIAGTSQWTDGSGNVTTDVNVGIGTSTPNAALEVAGNIIAATPAQPTHVVTKSYSDAQYQFLYNKISSLTSTVNELRFAIDVLNAEVFQPPVTSDIPKPEK